MSLERPLTPDERRCLAEALLVWRYIDHGFQSRAGLTLESEARMTTALRLAKALGVRDDYLALVFSHPILTVEVEECRDDGPPEKAFTGDVRERNKARAKRRGWNL